MNMIVRKILKHICNFIPSEKEIFILQGKLKWHRWIAGSGTPNYWLGYYEKKATTIVEKLVKKNSVFYDIGAHVGFFTILSSLYAGKEGKIFAFEPLPRNILYLKKHLAINKILNATIIEAAVSDQTGFDSFTGETEIPECSMAHFAPEGSLKVKTITLDDFVYRQKFPKPDFIKIDVEGAEGKVLKGAVTLLAKEHPTLLLSLHWFPEKKPDNYCQELLSSLGYNVLNLYGEKFSDADDMIVATFP